MVNKLTHLIIVLFMLFSFEMMAQKKKSGVPNLPSFDEAPLHFGFLLGFNTMDFKVVNSGIKNDLNNQTPIYGDVIHLQPGINIGIVTNLKLRRRLDLRFLPGISFGQRDLYFISSGGAKQDLPLEIKSTYLDFPLLIKYSSVRQQNFKPYAIAGVDGRIDLAKSKKDKIVLNPLDASVEFGAGIDTYLTYFRLSIEIRASYGLTNVLNEKGTGDEADMVYTQAIQKLTSNIFHLTFYFE